MSFRIGIDLMGGDGSPHQLFQAVAHASTQLPESVQFSVIATAEVVADLAISSPNSSRISSLIAEDFISMEDSPLHSVRIKKRSSLILGIQALREGNLQALISLGNTGAIIASAMLYLPRLPGIEKLALLATLPTRTGAVAVLDVGGNVAVDATQLLQFAHMGAAYVQRIHKIAIPKVGLLNIGAESKKGTQEHQKAFQLLQQPQTQFQFLGNVEGRDVFHGVVDVLVTDGFTGNVFLKTSEGVSAFIFDCLRELPGSKSALSFLSTLDYEKYPGAVVCGVEPLLIKCHGNASPKTLLSSILGASKLLKD